MKLTKVFDNGEAVYYNVFHKNRAYQKLAEDLRRRYPDVETVLEIGCGTGLLSVELEHLGFKVTGIDNSSMMLSMYKGKVGVLMSVEELSPKLRFDLVLAPYDVLNYINFRTYPRVMSKLLQIGRYFEAETWPNSPVRPFTYRSVDGYHRVRLGFRLFNRIYLWFVFWGSGFVISFHKLYFH